MNLPQSLMQQYFDRMSMFVGDRALPQRIRFMIQDVIDLRRDRWVPRKAVVGDGPLPINQVRSVSVSNGSLRFRKGCGW